LKALLKDGAFLFQQAARKTLLNGVLTVNSAGFIDVK
jgi:hypothetical protein